MSEQAVDPVVLNSIRKELTGKIATRPDFPKPGVQFKDIQSILTIPVLAEKAERGLKLLLPQKNGHYEFDSVIAFDARGFIFGYPLAKEGAAALILARKAGKLPGPCIAQKFTKEYGEEVLEIQEGIIQPGDRVLVHDDVLATGGTAEAAAKLVLQSRGTIAGFNFLIEVEDQKGRELLRKYVPDEKINALLKF